MKVIVNKNDELNKKINAFLGKNKLVWVSKLDIPTMQ
jgi:hypothetical protein